MTQRIFGTTRLYLAFAPLMLMLACGSESTPDHHATVRINELSSSNHNFQDANGDTDDWIELINLTSETIDLSGYFISDTANNRLKFQVENGVSIAAKGLLVFYADGETSQGVTHMNFKLSSDGDGACLSNAQGYVLDCIRFSAVPLYDAGENTSLARFPDGTGPFQWCSEASAEKPNGARCSGSLL